ncbi:MAG: hypothetical protein FWD57_04755 [Polyangiaceae bacterium]|nr:hypothetical protein [Polyangiaceae bacterium]
MHTQTPILAIATSLILANCGGTTQDPATSATSDPAKTPGSTADNTATGQADQSPGNATTPTEPTPPADPYADMEHPPPTDSGRLELIGTDASTVVTTYRPHLRKTCWTPRISEDTAPDVKVVITMQIEVQPDGLVRSVVATGGSSYPGLSKCVQEHASRWHFPTAKRVSTLMFPVEFTRGEVEVIRVR